MSETCSDCGQPGEAHDWDCPTANVKVVRARHEAALDRTPLQIVSETLGAQLVEAKKEQEKAMALFMEATQRREHAEMAVHLIESALRGLNSETTVADPFRHSIDLEKERLQARAMGRNL